MITVGGLPVREYEAKRRKIRILLGLCLDCREPVFAGTRRCQRHLERYRAADQRRRKSRPWRAGGTGRPPVERRVLGAMM